MRASTTPDTTRRIAKPGTFLLSIFNLICKSDIELKYHTLAKRNNHLLLKLNGEVYHKVIKVSLICKAGYNILSWASKNHSLSLLNI